MAQPSTTPETNEHHFETRLLQPSDYPALLDTMQAAYPNMPSYWPEASIQKLIELFPEGQICVEDHGRCIGFVLSIVVDYDRFGDAHTYEQITGDYRFTTHSPDGDVLYGIEAAVHPEYQGLRIGRRLYDARKEVCEQLNLRAIIAGGRMPGYGKHASSITPREYIDRVKRQELYDPVLSFQLANEFHVKRVVQGYLPADRESRAYATLIEWNNIYYEKRENIFGRHKSVVRIGLVQWQMRNVQHLESFFENVEFFVDAVSGYQADFIVFPEFFNLPLLAAYNDLEPAAAIRKLAEMTPEIQTRLQELAVSYNINIIGGSLPLYQDGHLYNIAPLLRRNGTSDAQYKLHVTPTEAADWGIVGGHELKVFDTDIGKIGINICYDSEFPELARIQADQGMKILFVPFSTDSINGYNRVRKCSEARAIENECYVAIAGSVGNLPKVSNMDVQYAQSAVFSPSDFPFPMDGIVTQGSPNTEQTLIADVDLDLLKDLHHHGSVRNLIDRRTDLFQLGLKE